MARRSITALWTAAFFVLLSATLSPTGAHAGQYVTVDPKAKVRLYYEASGSGDPVVFVPGWTMTSRYFSRQVAYFKGSKSTRFIVFDPRAHGRSSKTLEGANYVQHARDLKLLIDKLGLKHVVLGGWSWGMDTVYAYLSIYGSDNIRAVVDMDQTPNPLASGDGAWKDGNLTDVKSFFDDFTKDRVATTRGFIPTMFSKPPSEEDQRWMVSEVMMTPEIVADLLYYDGWMFDSTELVKTLKVPQLYFVSEGNAAAAKAFIDRNCPSAELVPLGEHAMFYDHADVFNERLASFLAKHP
ncbi:MAG: alpha/beta hydrolase [Proteobacteria bacterium]|nr:alpha/beta hydrolase [Pseudomonadota bacterium]